MRNRTTLAPLFALSALLLCACSEAPPQALGTLEWDRITLPAPLAEKIVRIDVREGQQVAAGAPLLQLEPTRTQSQLAALQAQAQQSRDALSELEAGPRSEAIAQARANLSAAQAQATDAHAYFKRVQPLGRQQLVAASDVDRARAAAGNAEAQVRAAQAALLELERGTRGEQIAQGRSAAAAAEAQAAAESVSLQKLSVVEAHVLDQFHARLSRADRTSRLVVSTRESEPSFTMNAIRAIELSRCRVRTARRAACGSSA